jgi:inhibitor of cysteine peptidase
VDGELRVALAANPTTGYSWEVSGAPDPAVLEQMGEAVYEASPTDTMVVGSGGVMTFEFQAVGAGTTTLELVYRRPWEDGVEPIETVTIDVTVEG